MNEIWLKDAIKEDGYKNLIYFTIEEGCEYQKEHPEKIISLYDYDPKGVVEYIKNSGAKYIY